MKKKGGGGRERKGYCNASMTNALPIHALVAYFWQRTIPRDCKFSTIIINSNIVYCKCIEKNIYLDVGSTLKITFFSVGGAEQ